MAELTVDTDTVKLDAKLLYRRLDSILGVMDRDQPQSRNLKSFLERSFRILHQDLHLTTCILYQEKGDRFHLQDVVGSAAERIPEELDPSLRAMRLIYRHLVYIFVNPDADDSPHRQGILPRCASAGLMVGNRPNRIIIFFLMESGYVYEELDFTLNTVRAALGTRLMEERLRGSISEAAEIQQSLLLEDPPDFPGYDIACRSIPAEEVGGDFYDFQPLGGEMLAFSIGDASGHGLPAALLVRDVVTGLRMGIERNLKAAYVMEKLNRVIHRSRLSSRFVSLFYGELESSGYIIYVNAGHHPPLLFGKDSVLPLDTGGRVIGPIPEARFQRGYARMEHGDALVLCTDGILERSDAQGDFFGKEGLTALVQGRRGAPAEEMLDCLIGAAFDHGRRRPWEDDATVVIINRR